MFKSWGATGLLVEYEDTFPFDGDLSVLKSHYAYRYMNIHARYSWIYYLVWNPLRSVIFGIGSFRIYNFNLVSLASKKLPNF